MRREAIVISFVAILLFLCWMPFAAGHPLVDGTVGILLFISLPLFSTIMLWLAIKLWQAKRSRKTRSVANNLH
jgi:heme/copper-type cytochrome/quinol oxidase subunit 2